MKTFCISIFLCFVSFVVSAQCNPTFLSSCSNANYIDSVYILGQPISNSTTCTGFLPSNLTVYNDTVCWRQGIVYWQLVRTSDTAMFVSIYADLNGDNNFNQAGENIYYQFSSSRIHSGNIALPPTAILGVHKLRIIASKDSIHSPCDTLNNGEAEEYFFSLNQINPYPINCNCPNSFTIINDTSCNNKQSPGGNQTWTSSGFYADTLMNVNGCDSFLQVNLIIHSLSDSIFYNNNSLQALESGKNYQWFDCNINSIIPGATNQSYTPSGIGSYSIACIISDSNCIDTTVCKPFIIGTTNDYVSQQVSLSPNPAIDQILINSTFLIQQLVILNSQGQVILEEETTPSFQRTISISNWSNGVYYIKIKTSKGFGFKKLNILR